MITLSEVETRVTATSSGVLTRPTECITPPIPAAIMKAIAKLASERSSTAPRNFSTWISRPARNRSAARPICANSSTDADVFAMSSTCGPTSIPPTSSKTIAGTKARGSISRSTGARKAMTATITKLRSGIAAALLRLAADAEQLDPRIDPLNPPLAGERVVERVAGGRLRVFDGEHASGSGDCCQPARQVDRPPVPVAAPGQSGAVGDACAEHREVGLLGVRGLDEVEHRPHQRLRIGRDH